MSERNIVDLRRKWDEGYKSAGKSRSKRRQSCSEKDAYVEERSRNHRRAVGTAVCKDRRHAADHSGIKAHTVVWYRTLRTGKVKSDERDDAR